MDPEQLIEEIQKFPVLYDKYNKKYRNVEYKERVWKIISTNVQAEGGVEECKKRWNSIRDQLRRTLQKRKKYGHTPDKNRKYKYEDNLTFLLPHLSEIEGLTNVTSEENDGSENIADDSQEENISNVDVKEEPGTTNGTNQATSSPLPTTVSPDKHKFATPSAAKKKISVKPQESPASELMSLAGKEAENTNTQSSQTNKDPVDAFLCGIAPTLKSLNPILLNEAKGKIFSIVHELEMRQLQMITIDQGRYYMPPYSMSLSQLSACPSSSIFCEESKAILDRPEFKTALNRLLEEEIGKKHNYGIRNRSTERSSYYKRHRSRSTSSERKHRYRFTDDGEKRGRRSSSRDRFHCEKKKRKRDTSVDKNRKSPSTSQKIENRRRSRSSSSNDSDDKPFRNKSPIIYSQ